MQAYKILIDSREKKSLGFRKNFEVRGLKAGYYG